MTPLGDICKRPILLVIWEKNSKRSPLAHLTLDRDNPPVGFDDTLNKRKPQARPRAGAAVVTSIIAFEDVRKVSLCNTKTAVSY
jgi:hypothetical protein